jgi:peptidoglycan LD-endopeptidase LytH
MNTKTVQFIIILFAILCPLASVSAATSSDDADAEFQRNTSRWRESSKVRDRINDLDDDPVEDIAIPVLFGVSVRNLTKNFGDPRAGHSHEGLDIMAPEGIPIVSPVEAVVTKAGVWSGAGNFVSTAVAGEESFVYMHLSEIADIDVGDVLQPGDVVGYVGHTGNAVATAPHLHFEIRDEDGDPTDPYPRLTKTFDLEDKMKYLDEVFDDADDETELAELLVTKYRSEFVTAQAQKIAVPSEIEKALEKVPASKSSTVSSTGILRVGSRGSEVVALQTYLIKKDVGTASKVVADGSFGPITRQALIDFQRSVDLTPDGVYGPKSKQYVEAHP